MKADKLEERRGGDGEGEREREETKSQRPAEEMAERWRVFTMGEVTSSSFKAHVCAVSRRQPNVMYWTGQIISQPLPLLARKKGKEKKKRDKRNKKKKKRKRKEERVTFDPPREERSRRLFSILSIQAPLINLTL